MFSVGTPVSRLNPGALFGIPLKIGPPLQCGPVIRSRFLVFAAVFVDRPATSSRRTAQPRTTKVVGFEFPPVVQHHQARFYRAELGGVDDILGSGHQDLLYLVLCGLDPRTRDGVGGKNLSQGAGFLLFH